MLASTKVVLIMEYDGTNYHGFQWQANLPTVQEEIEKAIGKFTGERRRIIAASRTDAGVHAKGQVVSFRTDSALPTLTFTKGLNYYLPRDIVVKAAFRVADSFNVRRDAISREYQYFMVNRPTRSPLRRSFAYLIVDSLDIEAMNQACQALIGRHDFASFVTRSGAGIKDTIRHIYRAEVSKDEDLVTFYFVANSFLPHQVRNTVGSLIKVGLGKMTIDEFYQVVDAKGPGLAGPVVPAYGLCLTKVNYPLPLEEICH